MYTLAVPFVCNCKGVALVEPTYAILLVFTPSLFAYVLDFSANNSIEVPVEYKCSNELGETVPIPRFP